MATKNIKKILLNKNGDKFVADIENIENRISQNSSNLETAKQELSDKCDTVLNDAKAYTDQEKAKYMPITGGKVSTTYVDMGSGSPVNISQFSNPNDEGMFIVCSGTRALNGACLYLSSIKDTYFEQGSAVLSAVDQNHGTFTFTISAQKKEIRTSYGSVPIISNYINKTNNHACCYYNQGLKIQCVRISGNQGQKFGTINWPIPFTNTNYHVFATSEDPDENIAFQVASVTYLNKTTTSCKVGHKITDSSTFFEGGYISVLGIGV